MKHGKQLWAEDDATRFDVDHVHIEDAYQDLFHADYRYEPKLEIENHGDEFWYRTQHAVVCHSYDGYYVFALPEDKPNDPILS